MHSHFFIKSIQFFFVIPQTIPLSSLFTWKNPDNMATTPQTQGKIVFKCVWLFVSVCGGTGGGGYLIKFNSIMIARFLLLTQHFSNG